MNINEIYNFLLAQGMSQQEAAAILRGGSGGGGGPATPQITTEGPSARYGTQRYQPTPLPPMMQAPAMPDLQAFNHKMEAAGQREIAKAQSARMEAKQDSQHEERMGAQRKPATSIMDYIIPQYENVQPSSTPAPEKPSVSVGMPETAQTSPNPTSPEQTVIQIAQEEGVDPRVALSVWDQESSRSTDLSLRGPTITEGKWEGSYARGPWQIMSFHGDIPDTFEGQTRWAMQHLKERGVEGYYGKGSVPGMPNMPTSGDYAQQVMDRASQIDLRTASNPVPGESWVDESVSPTGYRDPDVSGSPTPEYSGRGILDFLQQYGMGNLAGVIPQVEPSGLAKFAGTDWGATLMNPTWRRQVRENQQAKQMGAMVSALEQSDQPGHAELAALIRLNPEMGMELYNAGQQQTQKLWGQTEGARYAGDIANQQDYLKHGYNLDLEGTRQENRIALEGVKERAKRNIEELKATLKPVEQPKPPSEHEWIDVNNPSRGVRVIPGSKLDIERRTAQNEMVSARQRVQTMREFIQTKGSTELTGAPSGMADQLYSQIVADIAKLRNMGVLQPGELSSIESKLVNPASLGSIFSRNPRVLAQYKTLLEAYDQKLKDMDIDLDADKKSKSKSSNNGVPSINDIDAELQRRMRAQ